MNTSNTMEHVLGIHGIKNDALILEILKEKFGMNFSRKIPSPSPEYPLTYDPPMHLIIAALTAYLTERKKDETDLRLRVMDLVTPEDVLTAGIVPDDSFLRVRLTYTDANFKIGGKTWNGTLKELISRLVSMTDEELEFILSEAKSIFDRSLYVSTSNKYSAIKYMDYIVYSIVQGVMKSDFIVPTCVDVEVVKYDGDIVDAEYDDGFAKGLKQIPPAEDESSPSKPVTRSKKAGPGTDEPQQHVSISSGGSDASTEDADDVDDAEDAGDAEDATESDDDGPGDLTKKDTVIDSITYSGRETSMVCNFIKSTGFLDVFTAAVIQDDPHSTRKNDPDTVVFFRRDSSKSKVLKEVARCGKKSLYQTFFRITKRFLQSDEGFLYQCKNTKKYNLRNMAMNWDTNTKEDAELLLFMFMVIDNAVTHRYIANAIAEDKDNARISGVNEKNRERLMEIGFDDILRFFTSSRTHEYLKIAEERILTDASTFNEILGVVIDVIASVNARDGDGKDGIQIKRGPGRPRKMKSAEPPAKKAKTSRDPVSKTPVHGGAETSTPKNTSRLPLEPENTAAANALCDLSAIHDFDVNDPIKINTVGGEHTVSTALLLEILDLFAKCRKCSPAEVVASMLEHGLNDAGVVAIAGMFGFGPTDRIPFDVVLFITKLAYFNIKRDVDDLMKGQVNDLHTKIRKSFG
jgi:hypothetical protein